MRFTISLAATALLVATLSSSALAQEVTAEQVETAVAAIEAAELTEDAYKNLWCGAAFGIVKESLTAAGNTADVATLDALQTSVFEKAATELLATGMAQEDFEVLATNFVYLAMSQTSADEGGEADFTQEECTAAAE